MLREVQCKPTWIVEEPHTPFGPGHHTYSDDVGEYIERYYEVLNLTRMDKVRVQKPKPPIIVPPEAEEDHSIGMNAEVVPVVSRFDAAPVDFDMSQFEGGGNSKKWGKKKSKGGGPF